MSQYASTRSIRTQNSPTFNDDSIISSFSASSRDDPALVDPIRAANMLLRRFGMEDRVSEYDEMTPAFFIFVTEMVTGRIVPSVRRNTNGPMDQLHNASVLLLALENELGQRIKGVNPQQLVDCYPPAIGAIVSILTGLVDLRNSQRQSQSPRQSRSVQRSRKMSPRGASQAQPAELEQEATYAIGLHDTERHIADINDQIRHLLSQIDEARGRSINYLQLAERVVGDDQRVRLERLRAKQRALDAERDALLGDNGSCPAVVSQMLQRLRMTPDLIDTQTLDHLMSNYYYGGGNQGDYSSQGYQRRRGQRPNRSRDSWAPRYDSRRSDQGYGDYSQQRKSGPTPSQQDIARMLDSVISRQSVTLSCWVSAAWRSRQDFAALLEQRDTFAGLPLDHPCLYLTQSDANILANIKALMTKAEIQARRQTGSIPFLPDPPQLTRNALWLSAFPTSAFLVAWSANIGWSASADSPTQFPITDVAESLRRWLQLRADKGNFAVARPEIVAGGASANQALTLTLEVQIPVYLRPNEAFLFEQYGRGGCPYETLTLRQANNIPSALDRARLCPATTSLLLMLRGITVDRLEPGRAAAWTALTPWATCVAQRTLAAVFSYLEAATLQAVADGSLQYRPSEPTPGFGTAMTVGVTGRPLGVQLLDTGKMSPVTLNWESETGTTALPRFEDVIPAVPQSCRDVARAVLFPPDASDMTQQPASLRAAALLELAREQTLSLQQFIIETLTKYPVVTSREAAVAASEFIIRLMGLGTVIPDFSLVALAGNIALGRITPQDAAACVTEASLNPAYTEVRQRLLGELATAEPEPSVITISAQREWPDNSRFYMTDSDGDDDWVARATARMSAVTLPPATLDEDAAEEPETSAMGFDVNDLLRGVPESQREIAKQIAATAARTAVQLYLGRAGCLPSFGGVSSPDDAEDVSSNSYEDIFSSIPEPGDPRQPIDDIN